MSCSVLQIKIPSDDRFRFSLTLACPRFQLCKKRWLSIFTCWSEHLRLHIQRPNLISRGYDILVGKKMDLR